MASGLPNPALLRTTGMMQGYLMYTRTAGSVSSKPQNPTRLSAGARPDKLAGA